MSEPSRRSADQNLLFGILALQMDFITRDQLVAAMRETHNLCDEHGDVASASLLEVWIDEAERRAWFLFEAARHGGA